MFVSKTFVRGCVLLVGGKIKSLEEFVAEKAEGGGGVFHAFRARKEQSAGDARRNLVSARAFN